MIVPFVLAFILSMVHFFSEEYSPKIERFHSELLSFSAGLFITFIFLDLLPEFFAGIEFAGRIAFLALLLGFVIFHIGEKYIYQHITNKRELLSELQAVHALGFFIDHFTVGVALFLTLSVPSESFRILIFIPLLLHTLSSSLSLTHLDEVYSRKSIQSVLLTFSPLLGVAFAFLISPAEGTYYLLFSFVVGALLYVVIRDTIPKGRKGDPLFFMAGFLLSVILLAAAGTFL